MLKRKIEDSLTLWKDSTGHKPLVIMGIRQCGKTFIAQHFAETNSWEASRIAFDSYQGGMEGKSTRNAERDGWTMGYNNASYNKKLDNLFYKIPLGLPC